VFVLKMQSEVRSFLLLFCFVKQICALSQCQIEFQNINNINKSTPVTAKLNKSTQTNQTTTHIMRP